MMMRLALSIGALFSLAPALVSAQSDVVGTLFDSGLFTTLISSIESAGLTTTLRSPAAGWTILAPEDRAFDKLPAGYLDFLLTPAGSSVLTDILNYHVIGGVFRSDALQDGRSLRTQQGQPVKFEIDGVTGKLTVEGAIVTQTDIGASNGVLHAIDTVLQPSGVSFLTDVTEAAGNVGFTTFVAALIKSGLDTELQDLSSFFTVFAPTNDAFNKLPRPLEDYLLEDPAGSDLLRTILLYHVLPIPLLSSDLTNGIVGITGITAGTLEGTGIEVSIAGGDFSVDGIDVIVPDLITLNGAIHVIESVLIPPSVVLPTNLYNPNDVVDTSKNTAGLTTFASAIANAGLIDLLRTPTAYYTIFAPTDDAFAALPTNVIDFLLAPEGRDSLAAVLKGHVLPTQYTQDDLESAPTQIITANGTPVTITFDGSDVYVDDAKITDSDTFTSNGVIHVIDKVLTPTDSLSMEVLSTLLDSDRVPELTDILLYLLANLQ